ncbi:MAG: hypothetical protein WB626_02815 [Bacteroidota bacterium]
MADAPLCVRCSGSLPPGADYCPRCGVLLAPAHPACDLHPDREAAGVCVLCERLLCGECAWRAGARSVCAAHAGVFFRGEWVEVFRSSEVAEADMARAVLESEGCPVHTVDFGPVGYVWEGGGEHPLSRSALNKPARVLVPIPEFLRAEKTLNEWRSAEAGSGE